MKFNIFIALSLVSCYGQLIDRFLPNIAKTSRNVLDSLTKLPLVSGPSHASGNLLAASVDTLTKIPHGLARGLGVGVPLPTFNNDMNVEDPFDVDITSGQNDDAHLDIRQLINKYGYQLQEYQVPTQDGYILTMFRIPGRGPPVFLQHGLMGSADDFIIAGPESGLAYLLSQDGYDVWMGNARGCKHSRRHSTLQPTQREFWDFSWHEIGVYDLPAMIDFVLHTTNSSSFKYVGHSQGTTAFFVMASERPDYNGKISLMVALSPVAYMSHVRSPMVRLLAPGTPYLHALLKTIGRYEFLPENSMIKSLKHVVCGLGAVSDIVCSNMLFMMVGVAYPQMNVTNLPVIFGHTPSGASTKQVAHYGQGVITGRFQQFDHGPEENMVRFGSETPPQYELENIVAPVSLFYSEADWLAHPIDVDLLYKRLSNAIDIHKIPFEQFNHLDFVWGKDVKTLIYDRIRKLFSNFN